MPQLRVNESILGLKSFFLFLGTLIRLVPILSACEACDYSTSSSSSSSGTRKPIIIIISSSFLSILLFLLNISPSLRTSTSLYLSLRFLPVILGLLVFILGNRFAFGMTSAFAPLTLFVAQLLLYF